MKPMGSDNLFHKKRERKVGNRKVAPDRFLIVCEGEKTEPNYFEQFKTIINEVRANSVEINIEGIGMNTKSLVEWTIELKNKANPDYSQVWCVFDRDSFKVDNFNNALQMAKNNGIDVAYSNQAFELWFLLHFNYYVTAFHRDQYKDKLSKLLGRKYEKSAEIYEELVKRGSQSRAIKNAERLLTSYPVCNPETDNPSTTVHLLVKELNRFII